MTKEALKLALEALESYSKSAYIKQAHPKRWANGNKAITAIKEALAQPEQEPVEWGVDWGPDGNSVSIIKRLADGNIEVLAWEYAPHPPQRTEQEQQIETLKRCLFQMQEAAKDLVKQAKSLPSTQRTWVGLTDGDIDECYSRDPRVAARNAEAKLKEKNT